MGPTLVVSYIYTTFIYEYSTGLGLDALSSVGPTRIQLTVGFLFLQRFSVGLAVDYSSSFILICIFAVSCIDELEVLHANQIMPKQLVLFQPHFVGG